MVITGLGWPVAETTDSGLPSVDTNALKILAGNNPKKGIYGQIYNFYKEKNMEEFGIEASLSVYSLIELRTIETLL